MLNLLNKDNTTMFEKATRSKLRFESNKGQLNVEQLWDLPLTSKTAFDLDSVAKAVNQELKSVTEESFVTTSTNPRKGDLELKLEIVKHIIKTKQDENSVAAASVVKREERKRLESILATKQAQQLEGLSIEDIQKRLDELG
jgi:hypothetical protein